MVTTVQWTVVSESPSSCAAKACSTRAYGLKRRNSTGSYYLNKFIKLISVDFVLNHCPK